MNLNQLKIFYTAAKCGNLSLAAEELFITQPAVTKGIQRLQSHYDIRLFNRFGKKMVLTDAGEVLFEIAEKIFDLESHAEESLREFQQRKRGRIRIHASESFGTYYLPSIMNPFSRLNPNIHISVNILPTEQVVEKVAGLQCDLGFISYPLEHKKVMIREILEDRLVLIVPPDHPFANGGLLSIHELEGQRMIVHEKGSAPYRILHEYIRKNNLSVTISLELSSNMAIKKAVESGLGLALISRKVAETEIRDGKLAAVPLPGREMKRKFYMACHRDKYISETLQALMDQVDTWAADYLKRIS